MKSCRTISKHMIAAPALLAPCSSADVGSPLPAELLRCWSCKVKQAAHEYIQRLPARQQVCIRLSV